MKRLVQSSFFAAVIIAIISLSVGVAVSGQKGSETKGRHYFIQNCKSCHTKGSIGSEVTPLNKTMAQWRAYFAAGSHNHGKEPLTTYLPPEQLLDASAFLINHAADSPQPETCGK